jgi:hypothetical protein
MIEEEYLGRKYCEPKAYWHCLRELEPSGAGSTTPSTSSTTRNIG